MVDSDNSRTLPAVTRRRLLSASAVWLASQVGHADTAPAGSREAAGDCDPVLILWREWMSAHDEAERLCEVQQRLERRMMSKANFPRVEVTVRDHEAPVSAFSTDEIDSLLGDGPEQAEVRARAQVALAEQQRTWNVLDERLGYSRAKEAELRASAIRDERANALWAEPALSRAGIAAKLHALLCMGREDCPDDEFPWRQISSVLMDIVAIGGGDPEM